MPRSTRIIRWRNRRQIKQQYGGEFARKALAIALLLSLLGGVLTLVIGIIGTSVAYARFTQALPDYDTLVSNWEQKQFSNRQSSKIYARTLSGSGEPALIYEINDPRGNDWHWMTLAEIPPRLIDATLAVEDPTFWQRSETSVINLALILAGQTFQNVDTDNSTSLTRALIHRQLLLNGAAQDGPPAFLETLRENIQELALLHRVSSSYSREQILEWHFNTVYYGNLAFGVEAAARVYFGKNLADLTLAEAAMLAPIPRSPSDNPIDSPPTAKQRQEQVLEAMADNGVISRDLLAAAQFAPVETINPFSDRFDVIAPHFALYVLRELEARFGPQRILDEGLQVFTSLDLEIQQQADCVSRAQINRLSGRIGSDLPADERSSCVALEFLPPLSPDQLGTDRQAHNAAIIILDAETSEIRSMVGSLNYWDEQIDGSVNQSSDRTHQPGTAIKPFVYLTALSQGYTAATMTLDVETDFGSASGTNAYTPINQDNRFRGPMRLREALGNGLNVPLVQAMSWVGIEKVLRTAHSMGINGLNLTAEKYGLTLALGGGEVTLLDMVYAHNVMNNMGLMLGQPQVAPTELAGSPGLGPVAIVRVEDKEGSILYEYNQPQRREILTPQLAFLMNDMLSDRSARCAALGCPNILELPNNRPAAVNSGTTNDFRDAWTIGYTPQLVAGVWIGNSDDAATNGLTGMEGTAPIWHALMSWAMAEEPVAVWTQPPDLVQLAVCNISGLLATPHCPTVSELFIAGTQPTVFDTIYKEFAINRETGRLATIDTPAELVEQRIYRVYPEQASAWADAQGIERPPTEYDTIRTADSGADNADIIWPRPFSFVSGEVEIRGTASGDDFDFYRLAYFKGLTPENLQIIAGNVTRPRRSQSLGVWDVSNLEGLFTLLLTVVDENGSFTELSVPLTVDNVVPEVEILYPRSNQEFSSGLDEITFRVTAEDNISVSLVRFYLDDSEDAFAASADAPFAARWQVTAPGCHSVVAVAVDAAGNEAESAPSSFCIAGE